MASVPPQPPALLSQGCSTCWFKHHRQEITQSLSEVSINAAYRSNLPYPPTLPQIEGAPIKHEYCVIFKKPFAKGCDMTQQQKEKAIK